MYAPKSPTRKGPAYAGSARSSFTPNRASVPDVNPLLVLVGQIRTAADNYSTSLAHVEDLSRALAKLSTFYLAVKFSEADISSLVDTLASLVTLPLPVGDIRNIARFISKTARADQPNLGIFKVPAVLAVFEQLLAELCRTLQQEASTESPEHMCDVLLGLACTLQNTVGVLGRHRQNTIRVLLLLHNTYTSNTSSTSSVAQLNLRASLVEALGYAYAVTSDTKAAPAAAVHGADATVSSTLTTRLQALFPGHGVSESTLSTQLIQVLVNSTHESQVFVQNLPAVAQATGAATATTATDSSTTTDPTALYHTTSAHLKLLTAALRALHVVFDHAQSLARATAKRNNSKAVSVLVLRLNHRNALLTALDALLKDSVGVLGKRLDAVGEGMGRVSSTTASSAGASTGRISSGSASAASTPAPAPGLTGSAFAKAAYRPPSQRNNNNSATTTTPMNTTRGSVNATSTSNMSNITTITTTTTTSATSTEYTTVLLQLKEQVLQWALAFLGSLAAHDPGLFLTNWKQFLAESAAVEDALEAKCTSVCSAVTALRRGNSSGGSGGVGGVIGGNSVANSTVSRGISGTSGVKSSVVGKLPLRTATKASYSPLLHSMLRSTSSAVRAAAVGAVIKLLTGLQLSKFYTTKTVGTIGSVRGSEAARSASTSRLPAVSGIGKNRTDDVGKYLHKIASALIVVLNAEVHQEVVELCCKLGALLLNQMPLSKVLTDRVLSVGSSSVYEVQAVTIYHLILRMSLRFEIPYTSYSTTTTVNTTTTANNLSGAAISRSDSTSSTTNTTTASADSNKVIVTSYVAMSWVIERCKGLDQTQAFVQALLLPYIGSDVSSGNGVVGGNGVASGDGSGNRKLHSASVSSIVSRNKSNNPSYTQSSYIYAAVYCLLRAIPPVVTNNLYCITVRTLNTVLSQYHPSLYTQDTPWLCSLLTLLQTHAQPALRLQGSKMLSFLLEYDLRSVPARLVPQGGLFGSLSSESVSFLPGGGNYVTDALTVSSESYVYTYQHCNLVGRSIQQNVAALYKGCVDEAHIVRTQAMLTLGALSPYVWRVLHGVYSAGLDGTAVSGSGSSGSSAVGGNITSVRVQLLRCLLVGTSDTIGTVRAAAFKSCGDCIVHLCMLLSAPDTDTSSDFGADTTSDYSVTSLTAALHATHLSSHTTHSTRTKPILHTLHKPLHSLWSATEASLASDMMHALSVGIADTKLSVRIQAAWALGNVLVNVIPCRWRHLQLSQELSMAGGGNNTSDSSGSGMSIMQVPWLQDAAWLQMYTSLLPLLQDSDKMLATAVRCIGNTTAGMFAHYSPAHHRCIHNLHKELIAQYLVPEFEYLLHEGRGFDFRLFEGVKAPILEHSQKLVFALSQAMGFNFHASVFAWDEGKTSHSSAMVSSVHIREIVELQMHFLRYGKLKIQLQAVQVLLYAVARHNEAVHRGVQGSGGDSESGMEDYVLQLVRLLECLFVLTRTTLSGGISTKHASSTISTTSTTTGANTNTNNTRTGAHASTTSTNTTAAAHSPTIPAMKSVVDSVLLNEQGQDESTETRAEVVQLFRSRATQLLHYFVLLLHSAVAQLWAVVGAGGRPDIAQAVLELLVFYGEDVTAWMEQLQAQHTSSSTPSHILSSAGGTLYPALSHSLHSSGSNSNSNLAGVGSAAGSGKCDVHGSHAAHTTCGFTYSSANTSVGLPHVNYDVTVELGVQGRTPQTLVAETCANLLRFTLPQRTQRSLSFALAATQDGTTLSLHPPADPSDSTGMSSNGVGGVDSLSAYRPERLPNVLSSKLESIAQYAPFAMQSLYQDAYSVTGLAHSYGVFDGLDHRQLYAPAVGSPVRSPHKVQVGSGGVYGSGGGGYSAYSPHDAASYALPSVQDGDEEDEF